MKKKSKMNNKEPFVSIVIPIYNVEKYIRDCIKSIISQTYENYEVILVDDGSPDNSAKIALEILQTANKRVRLTVQKNGGQYFARNTGEKLSTGEWIIYVDSDDVIAPNCIEEMIKIALSDDVEMIIPDFQFVGNDNIFMVPQYNNGIEFLNKQEIQTQFQLRNIKILTPATMYNLKWYRANHLKMQKVLYGEDVLFIWEALKYVTKVAHIKIPLYNYFLRGNSIITSSNYDRIAGAYPYYLKMHESYQLLDDASPLAKKFLFSRYVLATLHSSTISCSKNDFLKLYDDLNARANFCLLLRFPQIKVRILAVLGIVFPKVLYRVLKDK